MTKTKSRKIKDISRRKILKERRLNLSRRQTYIQQELGELCTADENGQILKSYITTENFKRLKILLKSLDIELLKNTERSFSYRQYCKLFSSYMFKSSKCGGQICCQAITEDGERCSRPASKFTSYDITETQVLPKIPEFLKKKLSVKQMEELKLIGFANTCCFYCWQHAAMYAAEKVTWADNYSYYLTHPEDLVSIFFKDVKPNKILGIATYSLSVGDLREPREIIDLMYKTYASTKGVGNSVYWGIFAMVFMYNTLEPILRALLQRSGYDGDPIRDMTLLAVATLLTIYEW